MISQLHARLCSISCTFSDLGLTELWTFDFLARPELGAAATEMATTLMHCVAVAAALKTLVVATRVQNDGLFGYLGCQNQFQTSVAVTRGYRLVVLDTISRKFQRRDKVFPPMQSSRHDLYAKDEISCL